jgi:hypothetical protein
LSTRENWNQRWRDGLLRWHWRRRWTRNGRSPLRHRLRLRWWYSSGGSSSLRINLRNACPTIVHHAPQFVPEFARVKSGSVLTLHRPKSVCPYRASMLEALRRWAGRCRERTRSIASHALGFCATPSASVVSKAVRTSVPLIAGDIGAAHEVVHHALFGARSEFGAIDALHLERAPTAFR